MKQNLFLLVICMTTSIFSYAQSVTWDGGAGTTSWTDATNWSNDAVPTAATDVLIDLSGVTVDISGAAVALMVEVKNSCTLNITSGAMLTIAGATADDGLETSPSGIIVNDGTIILSTSATNDIDGIYTKGTFTNNGGISIDGVGEHGIRMAGGSFTNGANGIINVTNVGQGDGNADGIYMDDDGGTPCLVTNNGTITVTMTSGDDGIYLKDASVFVNNSLINVDGTAGGDMALHLISPSSDFNNTGTLTISNAKDFSIQVDGDNAAPYCFLTNTGSITVNGGTDDGIRVRRGGFVNNNVGGTMTFNNSGDEGIQINDSGVGGGNALSIFNNAGTVDINTAVDNGMELFGNFNNLPTGVFNVDLAGDDGITVRTSTAYTAVFANDGEFRVDNSFDTDIETDELANFVNSATAKFFPGSSPGDLKIRYDFDLGAASVEFEIDGTAAATGYDQLLNKNSGNTLTISGATANLVWGFTPAVNDCFKIVDESGQVAGPWGAITSDDPSIVYTVDYFANSAEVIICVTALVVPVEMTYFNGKKSDRGTDLSWETASESNNKGFDIERSRNGFEWTKIGSVRGNDNSNSFEQYTYLDETPADGNNFYRLKQNDFDGNYAFSNVVNVHYENDNSRFNFYPNPVGDVLYLDLNEELENVEIQLMDINGKIVWNNVGWIEKISLTDISSGTYLLSVKSSSFKTTKKIIKK